MKYFTKECYEEIQVYGYLGLIPDFMERWDYRKDKKLFSSLLKFLPASFHPYIINGSLHYPDIELLEMIQQWRKEHKKRWVRMNNEYHSYVESIKSCLPKNAVQIYERTFHDAQVKSFKCPASDEFSLILDCRSAINYSNKIKLTFTGVNSLLIPENFNDAWWIYEEIDVCDKYFEFRVLCHLLEDNSLAEFTIRAENIQIKQLSITEIENKYPEKHFEDYIFCFFNTNQKPDEASFKEFASLYLGIEGLDTFTKLIKEIQLISQNNDWINFENIAKELEIKDLDLNKLKEMAEIAIIFFNEI